LSSGIAILILCYLLIGLLAFAAFGGFGLFRRSSKRARERERRRPGLLPKGYSHVGRSEEEERDMDVVRERFREGEEKAARAASRRAYHDSL